ncbi:uncharacterized protein DFL_003126 [Arthrobotrys flagrans]|uniref:Nephrocystin 3-like N-terminal domain-containing protein n=1 Tax=Arthrobotrys flagrans TaxID=97331 RepID=A0A437ACH7_ARTFL|nr:hypothetical protein DFL_003126 [Arthrobotrys flagrans]
MWLHDFISQDDDLKYCRTMTFGYNTKYDAKAKSWIEDYAENLLTELNKARSTEAEQRRPLVLMGHSFGGTIITHAFVKASMEEIYTNIYNSIRNIFFFGVPFCGIYLDDVLSMVDDDGELANQRLELVRGIAYGTERITQITQIFVKKVQETKTHIFSFYETEKTQKVIKKNGKYGRYGDYVLVVSKNSTTLGIPVFEEVLRADGNHSTIVKLKSMQDPTYTTVRNRLKKIIQAVETAAIQRPAQDIAAEKQPLEAPQSLREQDRLLDYLPYAKDASYNSRRWEHTDRCLPDTRVDLLKQITAWSQEPSSQAIFWLKGMAGTGKSTIARTVANELAHKGHLVASFFFSRGGGDLSHAGKFVTTIAIQLANMLKPLKHHICMAIQNDRNIASHTLRAQWNQLVLSPLSKLNAYSYSPQPFVLLIDALDECEGDNDIRLLLQLSAEMATIKGIPIRFFITSRPDTPIQVEFRCMVEILHFDLALHEVSRVIVNHDISVFFRVRFGEISKNSESLPADWPGETKIDTLVQKADGLFIYAATVCCFIDTQLDLWPPQGLLEVFLPQNEQGPRTVPSSSPTKELDAIYMQILNHSIKGVGEGKDIKKLTKEFRQVVGSIVILSEPLSAAALGRLLNIDQEIVRLRLRHLHSVLNVPEDSQICLLHPSFRDFLLDKERCHDPLFWVDKKIAHRQLATCCLERLSCSSTGLKRDICNLRQPGILAAEVNTSLVAQRLSPEIQYACQYWIQHLRLSEEHHYDNGPVDVFLRQHLLHWFEALALIGKVPQGVRAVALLESLVNADESPRLHAFIHDAKRFILYNRSIIEKAPL